MFVFCFCVCSALFYVIRLGGSCPHDDAVSSSSRCHGSPSSCPPFTRRGFRFFLCVFGLVAFFFFLLGWWGSPCRVFSPPPVSWFWVVGLGISACSCFLHLSLSLAARATWSSDPQPPRPPQLLVLVRATSPVSCWESSVGRAETKGCGVTGGVVTPHTV